ncbi:DUF2306 domain-containing protein [Amycolatopsis australiensis]|uniref:Predicted membrane protein n=1 Tax=Amycolatopsis australiensis TaxID=546364 RepID=A0A1K1RKR8_9PSEU|nr:DUF2306 domain-containing protein [Amycolatopsis australiensis]SFW72529.1 Predicted membrane protein [Amycolatopsis australiensis]
MTSTLEDEAERTSPERAEAPARTPFWRRPWIVPLAVAVVFYTYTAAEPFVGVPEAQAPLQPHPGFGLYYPLLMVHIGAGTVAMLTMVPQVWPWLHRHHPKVHRVTGQVYLLAVLVAGSAALVVVWWAPQPGKVGALCLTVFWLATTAAGYWTGRREDYEKHRRYMLYSFAIAASNMGGAYGLMVLELLGISVDPAYFGEAARWIPWVGDLMLVQWWLHRTARRPVRG